MSCCLFCAVLCEPTFKFLNGNITRISGSALEEHGTFRNSFGDDFVISEQLKVMFVLKNILNLGNEHIAPFLRISNPDFWISLCTPCKESVKKFFDAMKELRKLENLVINIPIELKKKIVRSRGVEGQGPAIMFWKTIRSVVLNETDDYPESDADSSSQLNSNLITEQKLEINPNEESRQMVDVNGDVPNDEVIGTELQDEEPIVEQIPLASKSFPSESRVNLGPQSENEVINNDGENSDRQLNRGFEAELFDGTENDCLFEEKWHIIKEELPQTQSLATIHCSSPTPNFNLNLDEILNSEKISDNDEQPNGIVNIHDEMENVSATLSASLNEGEGYVTRTFRHRKGTKARKGPLTTSTTAVRVTSANKRVVLNSKGMAIRTCVRQTSRRIEQLKAAGAPIVEYDLSDLATLKKVEKECKKQEKKLPGAKLGPHKNKTRQNPTNKKKFVCSKCPYKTGRRFNLNRHLKDKHPPVSVLYVCKQGNCRSEFTNKRALVDHLETHADDFKPPKCQKCGKEFITKANLSEHKRKERCKGQSNASNK